MGDGGFDRWEADLSADLTSRPGLLAHALTTGADDELLSLFAHQAAAGAEAAGALVALVDGDVVAVVGDVGDVAILGAPLEPTSLVDVPGPVAMTPPEYRVVDEEAVSTMRERGHAPVFEKEYVRRDGRRVPVLVGPVALEREPLRWISIVLDLTERRRLERALTATAARDRAARDAAERLRAVTTALLEAATVADVVGEVFATVLPMLGAATGSVGLAREVGRLEVWRSVIGPGVAGRPEKVDRSDRTPGWAVILDGTERWFPSLPAAAEDFPDILDRLPDLGPDRACLWLPLTGAAGRTFGFLALQFAEQGRPADEEREIVRAAAAQCATALERACPAPSAFPSAWPRPRPTTPPAMRSLRGRRSSSTPTGSSSGATLR